MIRPPNYFDGVRDKAQLRWEQLERDPELAGPWHQLFFQVQSPRHVFSELLQNADDAEAKNVRAVIQDRTFIFEHDGLDFTEENFASLCKFGYSNKRHLHTIGFRGIGFKSTFSLGDSVKLLTPTLSVVFGKKRFTEPVWDSSGDRSAQTQVIVKIKDSHRQNDLERNLAEWAESPVSLLFFRNIKRIEIQGTVIKRHSCGNGPIANSEWVQLSEDQKAPYLLIRSEKEALPEESIAEIRQERMGSEDFDLPPCHIDLVVTSNEASKIYVVLPTGVKTELPFIINGPFIQDPARVKIKDPETSPTNRWLLERAGKVAAECTLEWLRNNTIEVEERAKAYVLMPDIDRQDNTLEGTCGRLCEEAFHSQINNTDCLLTEADDVVPSGNAVSMSPVLYDIWSHQQLSSLFDNGKRSLISRHISRSNLTKLKNWNLLEEISDCEILQVVKKCHCPKPQFLRQLLMLWDYIYSHTDSYYERSSRSQYFIVPVQEKEVLYSFEDVVRLGEKKLLARDDDWEFLAAHLLVMHQGWPRFLAEQTRKAKEEGDNSILQALDNSYKMLKECDLEDASDSSQVLNQVAAKFFEQEDCNIDDCVRLAHIAAALGVTVDDQFQYVTCDGFRRAAQQVTHDVVGDLDLFVNKDWYNKHVLHHEYFKEYVSCTKDEWSQWLKSDRSKTLNFIPLQEARKTIGSRRYIEQVCSERGIKNYSFPFVTHGFIIEDWDYDSEHWKFWMEQSKEDGNFWGKLFARILNTPRREWANAITGRISQISTTGSTRTITNEESVPVWIMKLRDLPCIQDMHGWHRKPTDLFRRTVETEPLLDVEYFIKAEYDTEQNRPLLIKLGLQDKPTGPKQLLERLQALAKASNPPIYEVQKWYNRLDQMVDHCSTENLQMITNTFACESIILAEDETWAKSSEIFLQNNEQDVPDAATIHPTVRHLSIWHKIGVAIQPTAALAIDWLKSLESGTKLTPEEARRVGALLSRYATTIWDDCGHWLNLDGQWVPTDQLAYKLTMQSLVPWSNLFPSFKQKTADCQKLSIDLCILPPFSQLSNLASHIEDHIHEGLFDSALSVEKEWMKVFGQGIARIILKDEEENDRIRQLGRCLAKTRWQPTTGLEVIPYIDNTPAGSARQTLAAWKDDIFFVEDCGVARVFNAVAKELARPFDLQDITDAIKACVDRSAKFINEYLEENFKLLPPEQIEQPAEDAKEESMPKTETPATTDVTAAGQQEEDAVVEAGGDIEEPATVSRSMDDVAPAGQDETGQNGTEAGGETLPPLTRTYTPKPPKPRLIELFAKSIGYTIDGQEDRFYSYDGSWIQKTQSSVFPWERYTATGELEKFYWVKEHCLHKDPLQLNHEVWESCKKSPKEYSLVLVDREDNPIEISGLKLMEYVANGCLKLYPANYRLVMDDERFGM